ncbi:hypothetical protein POTOM_013717 [Populus tomentosa]|uniref:DNA (cytosine-5-)-methyltransferase n=1 Tax=Populus tomentosa TaxID=118781 RepID=A0A8X8A0S2_POPTO|nr:hypothetical protein POTOM_013717 [Populus tomentosa]
MDIVQFLKPKYVLMENVVDILRFDKASFARYALSRLVHMKYQARLGTVAAGCYGLPQFRLRVFLWGAHPKEKLPQFPLPSHEVIVRYWPPPEFERNTVAYDEDQPRDDLEKATVLRDAISDLPDVTSHETREKMAYNKPPETDFQQFIRSTRNEMTGSELSGTRMINLLYDHRPYSLTEEDFARVCQIPKKKELTMLPAGSKERANAVAIWKAPGGDASEQDRVLTIRECARLQGFPDYYRFCGTVKQRYRQIGNAVAVPVGRALGFALGMANERNCLKVECSSKDLSKGSPVACSSANGKLGCCEKRGCQSVLLTISDSEVGDSGEFEAKPLLLPWHGDNESQTGMVKCDDGSSVFEEEPLRMSPCFDFANENAVINESPINLDACPSKRVKIREENSVSGMQEQSPKKNSGKELSLEKASSGKKQKEHRSNCSLIGDPVPHDEAQERWHWRYEMKIFFYVVVTAIMGLNSDDDEDKVVWNVECHYTQADIEGRIINLGDCVYVKGEGAKHHIGSILEFFKTTDREDYFRVQWFYRAEETVMKEAADFHDNKRLFYSTVMNDNPIDCIISKVTVVQISPRLDLKFHSTPASDFYFDMEYCVDYSTFRTLLTDCSLKGHELSPLSFCDSRSATPSDISMDNMSTCGSYKAKLTLLDLFSGCGGMSTGLCLGAKVSCVDLVTRWALDSDESACQSLKLNHPETHVRNEAAEDFLELLKEWKKLCKRYAVNDLGRTHKSRSMASSMSKQNKNSSDDDDTAPGEYEVARLVDICYGKTDKRGRRGLKFKVHWKGYSTSEDSWEPIEGLSNCEDSIRDFVREGFKSKILPLPGDADVICGGPPCQGISGYNRYRNVDSPLADERNIQIVVFMDIVQFLKPKYVLMENVVDILRFDKASFARYALSRLVHMKYQARLGTVAAGCYGLPQFRLRVFLWGAHPKEASFIIHGKLPQFPLPSHEVIVRYWPPPEFERNTVAYDEDQPRDDLEKATVLRDAISDLPDVTSHETREKMAYNKPPETDFQQFIRSTRNGNVITPKLQNLVILIVSIAMPEASQFYLL